MKERQSKFWDCAATYVGVVDYIWGHCTSFFVGECIACKCSPDSASVMEERGVMWWWCECLACKCRPDSASIMEERGVMWW